MNICSSIVKNDLIFVLGINDLIIKATCTENGLKKETTALADVITNCDPSSVSSDQKNLLCFDGTLMNFTITENVLKSVLGKLSVYSGINNGFTREYILVNSKYAAYESVTFVI